MDDKPLIKKIYSRKYPIAMEIVIGDGHIGHKTGIVHPKLEDYKPNDAQSWLFNVWDNEFLPEVSRIKKQVKPKYTHLLVGGDMGDLDWKSRGEGEYWAWNITQIKDNALELLKPLFNLADHAHVLKGTKAHTGGRLDEDIARNFDNVVKRNDFHYAHYKCMYEYCGVLAHAQHKGVNTGKWAKRSLMESLRSKIIVSYHERRAPTIAHRFHFHHGTVTDLDEPPIVSACPSWQLPNSYVSHIDPVGGIAEVGGFIFLYQNNRVVDKFELTYAYEEGEQIWRPK